MITRKSTSAICLALLLTAVTSSGIHLQAQKRDRLITPIRSGMVESFYLPDGSRTLTKLNVVEVIGFSLKGTDLTLGQVFQADDDWLTDLRVKVRNISGKPISHLRMTFGLPEAKFMEDGRKYSVGLSLDYQAGARANKEAAEMKIIQPGDEVELVYLETGVPFREEIANKTGVISISILQYGGNVTAFFVDGTQWNGSNLPVGKSYGGKTEASSQASAAEIAELRSKAQDKEKRNLTVRKFKDMPLKIRAIRNLDSDTWHKDLEIEVKNVGVKPIYSILGYLEFPDEKLPGDDVSGIVLRFGERKYIDIRVEADAKDPHLNPGDTYVFTIDEKYRKGLETRHQRSPELFRHLDLHFGVISFGDGTGFEVGDPTDYRRIKKSSGEAKQHRPLLSH